MMYVEQRVKVDAHAGIAVAGVALGPGCERLSPDLAVTS